MKTEYAAIPAYQTKDGSEIRELMHPSMHGNRQQSLAEATVYPGQQTRLHAHRVTEELYHVTAGAGVMNLAGREFPIGTGDTVFIPPGTDHQVRATGSIPLRILCCSSPAYSHDDTVLRDTAPASPGGEMSASSDA